MFQIKYIQKENDNNINHVVVLHWDCLNTINSH